MSITTRLVSTDSLAAYEARRNTLELDLSMGSVLPIFWLALFDPTDIVPTSLPSWEEWPLLICESGKGKERLKCRSEALFSVLHDKARPIYEQFSKVIDSVTAPYIVLDTLDMGMQFRDSPEKWKKHLIQMLGAFDVVEKEPTFIARLFGMGASNRDRGWNAYFEGYSGLRAMLKQGRFTPEELAGGSDEEDMPWQLI